MTGSLVPPESELSFTEGQKNQIYFRAVLTAPETEEKKVFTLTAAWGTMKMMVLPLSVL